MSFMEKFLDNQIVTDWNKGMLFPINYISSIYNIKKTTQLKKELLVSGEKL